MDEIKIDRLFMEDLRRGSRDDSIVRSMIKLGRGLGIDVVAEGIESLETRERLAQLRCGLGQGFYFSAPLAALEFERWRAHYDRIQAARDAIASVPFPGAHQASGAAPGKPGAK